MKAIFHIGMAKTGSSSIQTWLRTNRVALEAVGVYPCYPNVDAGIGIQEGIFSLSLKHAIYHVAKDEMGVDEKTAWMGPGPIYRARAGKIYERFKLQTSKLKDFSKKPGTYVHSHEVLFRCRKIQMIALDKYLSRYFDDRTYVVYIRNPVDFLPSMYAEKLRNNTFFECGTLGYSEFLNRCTSDLAPYGRESSFENLFDWKKILGDKLNVRLLEPDWLVNGDLIDDFASLLGVPTFCKPDRINESFAAEYIEYVRMLNLEFKEALPRLIRDNALRCLTAASSGKPKLTVSDAIAESIRELHRDQEERIRNLFFPERPSLYSTEFRGQGISPVPLTESRKIKIESMIQKNCTRGVGAA